MNIQTKCTIFGENACLLFSYAYIMSIHLTRLLDDYEDLVENGIIRYDCAVLNAEKLFKYYKINAKIDKTNTYIKNQLYVACYVYKSKTHFVVKLNDKIIFNPLDYSVCIDNGTLSLIEPYRVITIDK